MTSPIGSPTAGRDPAPAGPRVTLAVSTSGARGSLAVLRGELHDGPPSGAVDWEKRAIEGELATLKLAELLDSTSLKPSDLTHLAVNVGPGSFTGVRVGLNLVRALAYALGVPVAPFDALELVARRELKAGERGMIALKAIRGHWYAGVYDRTRGALEIVRAPCSVETGRLAAFAAENAARPLIEGEGLTSVETSAAELLAALGELAPARARSGFLPWERVFPLYVRLSEAEEKSRRGNASPP